MADITIRHEFDCDEETFWEKCIFSRDFNTQLYKGVLKFHAYDTLSDSNEPTRRTKKVRVEPALGNLPAAAKKVIGEKLAYTEEGALDKATGRYTFTVTPSVLEGKVKTGGELRCEKLGPNKIARVVQIHVEAKLPLIGGIIEEKIIGDLRRSYETAGEFTREWLKTHAS